MTSDSEPKFFDRRPILNRPLREHLALAAWGAALVVVIPSASPFTQRLILGVSLAALAAAVVLHFRARRRWRAEQAKTSEPDSTGA